MLRRPPPKRTRLPRARTPSLAATRDEATNEVVREQAPSHELSAVIRPAAASVNDSSVEKTAKFGASAPPATLKLTAPLLPTLPAASLWRAATV